MPMSDIFTNDDSKKSLLSLHATPDATNPAPEQPYTLYLISYTLYAPKQPSR